MQCSQCVSGTDLEHYSWSVVREDGAMDNQSEQKSGEVGLYYLTLSEAIEGYQRGSRTPCPGLYTAVHGTFIGTRSHMEQNLQFLGTVSQCRDMNTRARKPKLNAS